MVHAVRVLQICQALLLQRLTDIIAATMETNAAFHRRDVVTDQPGDTAIGF